MTRDDAVRIFVYVEAVLIAIVVIAGAVVTIVKPHTLPFEDYVADVTVLAGALGIGGGLAAALRAILDRRGVVLPAQTDPKGDPHV
jgi:hypothetical protein